MPQQRLEKIMLLHEPKEFGGRDNMDAAVLGGEDRRSARLRVQHRQLAQQLARSANGQERALTTTSGQRYGGRAVSEQEHMCAWIALSE